MDGTSNHWGSTVALYSARMLTGSLTMCGVGTPSSGSCPTSTGFTLLTDDWGLGEDQKSGSDNDQNSNQPDQSVVNPHFYGLGGVAFKQLVETTPPIWTPYVAPIDVPTVDSKFGDFILAYQGETAGGPGTGPTITSSASITYAEGNKAWDQTSESYPMHHAAIAPQTAADATYTVDNGDPRTQKYLGLP